MLGLSQKLHICTYNRRNFSGDRPLRNPWHPNCMSPPLPKVEVLKPPLVQRDGRLDTMQRRAVHRRQVIYTCSNWRRQCLTATSRLPTCV